MGTNGSPYANQVLTAGIEANPAKHEAVIQRQGQLVRLFHTRKCACFKNGKKDMFCDICGGKGVRLGFQETYKVIDENPARVCNNDSKLKPYWTPIASVDHVQKVLHESQGGNVDFEIDNFNETEITLVDNGKLPKPYENVKLTYDYKIPNKVIGENSERDGSSYIIRTIGTKYSRQNYSNYLNVHGDLSKITRVENITQGITYNVKSFGKQSIILDDENGTKPAPVLTDILEVDYEFVTPIKIGIININQKNAHLKWGAELKEGSVETVVPGGYYVKTGDIFTLLTTLMNRSIVITKGDGTTDRLPFFDVHSIIGSIEDEDGTLYDPSNFEVQEYDNLVWTGSTPAKGKKYSVICRYHPSYILYMDDPSPRNFEDKRFPSSFAARKFDKMGKKEFDLL